MRLVCEIEVGQFGVWHHRPFVEDHWRLCLPSWLSAISGILYLCTKRQVIILPGAFVSPYAYPPLARDLARKGHPSFIVRLPFGLGELSLAEPSLPEFLAGVLCQRS